MKENGFIVNGRPQESPIYIYMIDNFPDLASENKPKMSDEELEFVRDWILVQDPLYIGDDILGGDLDQFTPVDGGVDVPLGVQLYAVACSSCHGNLNVSEKRNRSAIQIQNAIDNDNNMRNIPALQRLTPAEVQAIADVLNN